MFFKICLINKLGGEKIFYFKKKLQREFPETIKKTITFKAMFY